MGGRNAGPAAIGKSLAKFGLQLLADARGNRGGGCGGEKSESFFSRCPGFFPLPGSAVGACEGEKKTWLLMMAHLHHALGALARPTAGSRSPVGMTMVKPVATASRSTPWAFCSFPTAFRMATPFVANSSVPFVWWSAKLLPANSDQEQAQRRS